MLRIPELPDSIVIFYISNLHIYTYTYTLDMIIIITNTKMMYKIQVFLLSSYSILQGLIAAYFQYYMIFMMS